MSNRFESLRTQFDLPPKHSLNQRRIKDVQEHRERVKAHRKGEKEKPKVELPEVKHVRYVVVGEITLYSNGAVTGEWYPLEKDYNEPNIKPYKPAANRNNAA